MATANQYRFLTYLQKACQILTGLLIKRILVTNLHSSLVVWYWQIVSVTHWVTLSIAEIKDLNFSLRPNRHGPKAHK